MICWIQVLETWSEDILIWPHTTDGEYSVRSAYRVLVEEDGQGLPSSSSSGDSKKFWKKLWKIRVPNRIWHFLWRAVKDSLPMKQNLNARHVPVNVTCDRCDDHPNTILHCLWLCDEARSVWWSDLGFQFLHQKKFRSFYDLVEVLLNEGSSYRVALFATIAWGLWQRLNRLRENLHCWQLQEIGGHAKELVANVDAAMFVDLDCTGIRVGFRDHEGHVIAALSQRIPLSQAVEMAEALAVRWVVVFAQELSLTNVIIGRDCLRAIHTLVDLGWCKTLFTQVIEETKRLGESLRLCQFLHVKWDGNKLTHALARRAVSSANTVVWVEELPNDLDDVFQSDFTLL